MSTGQTRGFYPWRYVPLRLSADQIMLIIFLPNSIPILGPNIIHIILALAKLCYFGKKGTKHV